MVEVGLQIDLSLRKRNKHQERFKSDSVNNENKKFLCCSFIVYMEGRGLNLKSTEHAQLVSISKFVLGHLSLSLNTWGLVFVTF